MPGRSTQLLALLATTACAPSADAGRPDRRFVPAVRAAANGYQAWGRVDEKPNIAPFLCRAPAGDDFGVPSQVRRSRARTGAHGEKLYYLWASERDAYLMLDRDAEALPVGFTVVKQSFSARPLVGDPPVAARPGLFAPDDPAVELAPISWMTTRDGRRLQVDQPADLYVMIKVGAGRGTDDGWIYGTVSPDGDVTSAGRVESCMRCHESARHERLFGLRDGPRPSRALGRAR
jgi:hypothetical protein